MGWCRQLVSQFAPPDNPKFKLRAVGIALEKVPKTLCVAVVFIVFSSSLVIAGRAACMDR
jgi:hypothetical protein